MTSTAVELPLLTRPAADGGMRYALNMAVGDPLQNMPLLIASTYNGVALQDEAAHGTCKSFGRCFNSSQSSSYEKCDAGVVYRTVSSTITLRSVCATDLMAFTGASIAPVQSVLSMLQPWSAGLVLEDVESDDGLAPVVALPEFWGTEGASGILGIGVYNSSRYGGTSTPLWTRVLAAHGGTLSVGRGFGDLKEGLRVADGRRERLGASR